MATHSDPVGLTARELRRASPGDVKSWLQDALVAYYREPSATAFAPFERYIGRDDFLAADLNQIYQSVGLGNRSAWRKAVADLVAELPASAENADALATLIDLARFIPAYEVFDRAGNRLRSTRFAGLTLASGQTLFVRTLSMAIELAAQTDATRDLLLHLVESPSFDPAYSLPVLCALARTKPANWTEYLADLRPKIERMIIDYRPSERALKRHAVRLLGSVKADRILRGAGSLRKAPDGADRDEEAGYDNWLLDALFFAEDALLPARLPVSGARDIIFTEAGSGHAVHRVSRTVMRAPIAAKAKFAPVFAPRQAFAGRSSNTKHVYPATPDEVLADIDSNLAYRGLSLGEADREREPDLIDA